MPKGIASFTDEPFLLNMINKKQLTKHYAGQHDQSTHGSWAHGQVDDYTLDPRFQNGINFDGVFSWDSKIGKFIQEYASEKGGSDADLVAEQQTAMKMRLRDEQLANSNVADPEIFKNYTDNIFPEIALVMESGKVCIAMDADSFEEMMSSGDPRFKTQFEIADSNGMYAPTVRLNGEARGQLIPVNVDASERPIYGYSSLDDSDENITSDGVFQYGEIRFVLKDSVKDRTTMTIGDSLQTGAIPMRMNKTPKVSDVIKATDGQIVSAIKTGYEFDSAEFTEDNYFETQIFGGVSLKDIEKIYVPFGWDSEDSFLSFISKNSLIPSDIEIVPYDV
jgi:hypothetical protein